MEETMAKAKDSSKSVKSGVKSGLVDIGEPAPAFELADQDGRTHTLSDYAGQWLVIYFYPKDDTPGCTKQACGFRDAGAGLKKRRVAVLGVSPDNEKSHRKFADKFSLPFPLLADTGQAMCRAYGVWQEKSMYGRTYMGVARTTYLVDPAGKVARRWDKVKPEAHADEVLKAVDELA
jgi:peroxiredoxin Q/BCP